MPVILYKAPHPMEFQLILKSSCNKGSGATCTNWVIKCCGVQTRTGIGKIHRPLLITLKLPSTSLPPQPRNKRHQIPQSRVWGGAPIPQTSCKKTKKPPPTPIPRNLPIETDIHFSVNSKTRPRCFQPYIRKRISFWSHVSKVSINR